MMDNGGEDGFREWKATKGWSLLAHTAIPWASLTWLWELWQPTGSLSCLCVQLPRTFLHPPLPRELCSFAHKIPSIRFFFISRHIEVLRAWGLTFCLQPKKGQKWGQTIWYGVPMESAPGLYSIWQQPLSQWETLLRIGFGSESVLQFLCNNRIRQS